MLSLRKFFVNIPPQTRFFWSEYLTFAIKYYIIYSIFFSIVIYGKCLLKGGFCCGK